MKNFFAQSISSFVLVAVLVATPAGVNSAQAGREVCRKEKTQQQYSLCHRHYDDVKDGFKSGEFDDWGVAEYATAAGVVGAGWVVMKGVRNFRTHTMTYEQSKGIYRVASGAGVTGVLGASLINPSGAEAAPSEHELNSVGEELPAIAHDQTVSLEN